jgi:hypothetical protein
LFYYAIPYYHFGARAKYNLNAKWSVTGFATNGWNNVVESNTGKTGGFSLAYTGKKVGITETYLTGPRDIFGVGDNGPWNNLSDTVLTYTPNGKLSLMANFDYDHQGLHGGRGADYTGIAAYAKYAVTPKVAVVGRVEYLNDHDGLATGTVFANLKGQHIYEYTGTLERTFAGHLISRLEYRHDDSDRNFFQRGNEGQFVGGQNTVDVGLIFVLQPAQ